MSYPFTGTQSNYKPGDKLKHKGDTFGDNTDVPFVPKGTLGTIIEYHDGEFLIGLECPPAKIKCVKGIDDQGYMDSLWEKA